MVTSSPPRTTSELVRSLAAMAPFLREAFGLLTPGEASAPGPGGAFAPVEQVWHLADLESEGFGVRIRRLRDETDPHLPDFDGARVAKDRNYVALSLPEGLRAFETARAANIATLLSLEPEAWARGGTQEGVGPIALRDLPLLMRDHDRAHIAEIREWRRHVDQPAD